MTLETHSEPLSHLDPESTGRMQKLGVLLLIVGDAAFVLALVFTYLYLRALNTEGQWLGPDQPGAVSTAFSWGIGAVALLSWAAYWWAQSGRRPVPVVRVGVLVASVLVVVDLCLQVAQMIGAGFTPRDGAYQSAWMALAGYHVVHLLVTLFLGIGIAARLTKGRLDHDRWHLQLVGYWWRWMAATAVIITVTTSLTTATS